MNQLVSKAKEALEKLFPKRPNDDISESIYRNSLDSQLFFKFQRSFLESEHNLKNNSDLLSLREEIKLNKFKEMIVEGEKNLDSSWTHLDPLKEPDYEELARIHKKEEKKKKHPDLVVETESSSIKGKKKQERKIPLLNNWKVGEESLERELLSKLKQANINSIVVFTDNAYTRQLVGYRKLIILLENNKIPFFEYTNIQPWMNREAVNKAVQFCYKSKANSILVVGSNALIDFSKLIMRRLIKSGSLRLQFNSSKPLVASSYYSMFSVPTLVVPSTKLVEQYVLSNNLGIKKLNCRDNSIFLFNPIDSSDFVAYFPSFLLEYKKSKQLELLHLLFFRLIFSYFDSELSIEERMKLIREIKSIEWYLNYLADNSDLSLIDAKIIMEIAAKCYNGRYFMTKANYWTWFKLAANLTKLTGTEFYKSLALFFPSFLEYIAINEKEGHDRALELSYLLFGLASTEGLVLRLIKHIEKFRLPQKFFDIPTIKELDSKFISQLIKQSSPFLTSYKMTKTIIQNLAVW